MFSGYNSRFPTHQLNGVAVASMLVNSIHSHTFVLGASCRYLAHVIRPLSLLATYRQLYEHQWCLHSDHWLYNTIPVQNIDTARYAH